MTYKEFNLSPWGIKLKKQWKHFLVSNILWRNKPHEPRERERLRGETVGGKSVINYSRQTKVQFKRGIYVKSLAPMIYS